jgi:imidazolonepropionase-like amidohydrolase
MLTFSEVVKTKQEGSMLKRTCTIGFLIITAFLNAVPLHADTLIHAGRILNVRTGQFLENQGILISNEKIANIEPWDKISKTIDTKVAIIDLSKKTLLPGLIDTHTHLLMNSPASMSYAEALISKSIPYRVLEGAVAAKLTLEAGFTTVRDVENEGAGFADAALRDAIDNGLIPGLVCKWRHVESRHLAITILRELRLSTKLISMAHRM